MPKGQPTKYSKEFKLATVYMMKSGKFRPKEVYAIMDGIDRQTAHRWLKEYEEKGEAAFKDRAVIDPKDLKQAQKEIAQLKTENEILKKATAYFAKANEDE